MLPRWSFSVFACLVSLGCDDKKDDTSEGGSPAASKSADAPTTSAPDEPAVPRLKGAAEIPGAVPREASAVLVVRVPKSLYASIVAADPLGLTTDTADDLKTELDEFLGRTLGTRMLDAKMVAAFVVGKQDLGVVVVGVEGELQGKKVGTHEGVDLFAAGDAAMQLARIDDALVMGTEAAVKAAIAAAKDGAKSAAKDSDLAKLMTAHSEGAAMALAIDIGRAPEALVREIPSGLKIDRALVTFGADGLSLRAEGDKAKLDALAGAITGGLTVAADMAEEQRRRATKGDADIVEGAAAIIAAHYARSAKKMLEPKVDADALTISVPMKAGDPAVLAAVAGMSAAIAIPAFSKYMRRSKTSEARVQIAKMFDAASAYFNEEHVERAATTLGHEVDPLAGLASHKCPNDGNASGRAGVTPPLSVDCSQGPGGRCVPSATGGTDAGQYPSTLWTDNPVWNGLNFQMETAHAFHYDFKWANSGSGFGRCQFTAQAFGDLDGDGVFSTYERSGAADEYGVNAAAGLYIDQEVE
jgi:hypothetical protein